MKIHVKELKFELSTDPFGQVIVFVSLLVLLMYI